MRAVIPRYFVVAEATHEIQNPTSEEKLLLLGKRLGLGPDSRVLDVASGRGGPAVARVGLRLPWHGVEIAPEFHAVAVERAAEAGISDRVSFELGDAASVRTSPRRTTRRSAWARASCTAASPTRSTRLRQPCARAATSS